jgi:hypothetical protein
MDSYNELSDSMAQFMDVYYKFWNIKSQSCDKVSGWTTGRNWIQFTAGERHFVFSSAFRPVLGHTQSPVKWVLETSFPGWNAWDVKLTTCLLLVPGIGMLELYSHNPICLHGVKLNSQSTGTTLPFYGLSPSIYTNIYTYSSCTVHYLWVT